MTTRSSSSPAKAPASRFRDAPSARSPTRSGTPSWRGGSRSFIVDSRSFWKAPVTLDSRRSTIETPPMDSFKSDLEYFRDLGVTDLYLDAAPAADALVPGSFKDIKSLEKFIAGCPRCKLS